MSAKVHAPPVSSALCRAARGLLGWGLDTLASHSGVAIGTISRFENGRPIRRTTAERLLQTFASAGIEVVKTEGREGVFRTLTSDGGENHG